jgi:ABC-2 type transport system ATP-binding protein
VNDTIVKGAGISKQFGDLQALDNIDLDIKAGSILGLIGPNGAGKTTLLRSLLGLTQFNGEMEVLGKDPRKQRAEILADVCTIPDTAVLPRWMTVKQLLDYVQGVHTRFDRERAEKFLARTEVTPKRLIKQLSKGMTVQLHLALVMSIDARLLILDEPTLGLDILFRKQFFEQLLNDYYDEERTIIISTHQVEEVENILTDVMFIKSGRKVLEESMQGIAERYLELHTTGSHVEEASQLPWLGQRSLLGGKAFIFDDASRQRLVGLGELSTPSLADLFVAVIGQGE